MKNIELYEDFLYGLIKGRIFYQINKIKQYYFFFYDKYATCLLI